MDFYDVRVSTATINMNEKWCMSIRDEAQLTFDHQNGENVHGTDNL